MTHGVNLMSERAKFRAAAERLVRGWALAVGALILAVTPFAAWTWQRRRDVAQEQEALEAQYEPIRRLAAENHRVRAEAAQLVKNERTVLELSRSRPAAALLAALGEAVAAAEGDVFVERINVTQDPLSAPGAEAGGKLVVDVSCVEGYDVARLVKALDCAPFRAVKVLSSEAGADGEVKLDRHTIEGQF